MGLFSRKKKKDGAPATPRSTSTDRQPTPASSNGAQPPILSPGTQQRVAKEADSLKVRVEALRMKVEGESRQRPLDNARKRALYYEAEMLWQRIKDELPPGSEAASQPLLEAIDQLERQLLQLTPRLRSKSLLPRLVQRGDMVLRIVTCSLYLCLLGVVTFLPMITVVPVVDAVLRRLGWPRRFLIYELAKKASAGAFLLLAGVFYSVEGLEREYETPAILLFQHGSNLDGFLILNSYPQFFKSIGKDDIFLMPYVGWMGYVYGILPIDRKHRHEAIKQLGRATRNCARGVPVALSPEGTRSKSGQLMRFKKGPFYVQADAGNATITPLCVLGNYELWPPNYLFTCPGQVVMRYLPPIKPADLPDGIGKNKEELSRYVRRLMFEAIQDISAQPQKYNPGGDLSWLQRGINLAAISCFWAGAGALWRLVTSVSDGHGVSRAALGGGFLAYSVGTTAALYILYAKVTK